jgi:flagellar biosynthesis chaperone FliJ
MLAEARAAERVVEKLRENRAAEAAREEARRQQNLMDEAARKPK